MKKLLLVFLTISSILGVSCSNISNNTQNKIIIDKQGSFTFGGKVSSANGEFEKDTLFPSSNGQTYHSDHGYTFYQIPVNAKKYPIVFLHGGGQSAKSFETTPDSREGFQNIFLKKGYSVYLVDQPRRGRAGRSSVAITINPTHDEQSLFNWFRIGSWPDFFENVQFKNDEETLTQYFQQVTPNTGSFDEEVVSDSLSALFDRIGEGILAAHSQGAGPAFFTAIKNKNVKALVLYEPGGCSLPFPENSSPTNITMPAYFPIKEIPEDDFKKLASIPIVIYYGDNIPKEKSDNPYLEEWRLRVELVKKWEETLKSYNADVNVVILPEIGIYGNTHFPFSDLNNLEIADLLEKYLKEKNLE